MVQNTVARSDTNGVASSGTWTLGSAKGLNTLTASVPGIASVSFDAYAVLTSPDVSFDVIAPWPGQPLNDTAGARADMHSTYQIASVTVSAPGGPIAQLALDPQVNPPPYSWVGTVDLTGQPRGRLGVVFTATDVLGNTTDAVVPVVHDLAPKISVASPREGTLARPTLAIDATCTDDDPAGCVSLVAEVQGAVLASGARSISTTLDLSAYEGQQIDLALVAVDTIGRQTQVDRTVFVDSSPRLGVLAQLIGDVWDVSSTRILYLDSSGTTPQLNLRDLTTGATSTIETGADLAQSSPGPGFLTDVGAIYQHGIVGSPNPWLFELRNGVLSRLGEGVGLQVTGPWALYTDTPSSSLLRRDLVAGISNIVGSDPGGDRSIGPSGDIVYELGFNIYRQRGGVLETLTTDGSASTSNIRPVTDGINVVYEKMLPCCTPSGGRPFSIARHDGISESQLAPVSNTPPTSPEYAVANGYVAYLRDDGAGALQVWRHDPQHETQLTFFALTSTIDAIANDGTILLTNPVTKKRYRAVPGLPLQEIGSALGRVVVRDSSFFVVIGPNVVAVLP